MELLALIKDLLNNRPSSRMQWDVLPKALDRWNQGIAAAAETNNDIGIFDVIGADFWGEGVTAKRISGALRSIGKDQPVTININSPGGDLFEGLTIYNLLREHEGEVTVKVLGMAASAASIIAMGGDRIEIARGGFFMIHNAWSLSVGDRNDHREFADYLEPFDRAMGDIYAVHTGIDAEEVGEMMDRETWLGGQDAVDQGFADGILESSEVKETSAQGERVAARKLDIALAKSGMPRSERRRLLNELKSGTPSAAGGGTPNATATNTPRAVDVKAERLEIIPNPFKQER
ncbi:MAG: Clp protease ClpP [Alcanivoracaceae bacterium]|nr:Clp protease ClpP [Alcanivoracaceae bacterium]